jgi:cysteine-rich repeat protein
MGCLSDDEALEFAQTRMSAAAHADADAHIGGCAACRRLVAEALKYFTEDERHQLHGASVEQPQRSGLLLPGARVSRFEIIGVLGVGAAGVVYRAHDSQLQRQVALKLLRPDIVDPRIAGKWRQRFLFEAQAMARLSHPNVVVIYDAGVLDNQVFIAMELVEGETLTSWLDGAPRDFRQVVGIFLQLGRGLAAAHTAGVVHGDFKPENVLVAPDGRARIGDFGLARAAGAGRGVPTPALSGTPIYMAPEQLTGRAAPDTRSDQFSFCVALYRAVYGHHPVERPGQVRRPSAGHAVPAEVHAVLARGLSAHPEARHPSMVDVVDALERAMRRAAMRRTGRRIATAALGAAIMALAAGGVWRVAYGPRCGDGRVDPGEQCDDGNASNADGCVAKCQFARCGDGFVRAVVESCDDGNTHDGDGCSASCVACSPGTPCQEQGWTARPGTSHAYRLFSDTMAGDSAAMRCARMGAHLAIPADQTEQAFVAGFSAFAAPGFWIGINDRAREGDFRSLDGRRLAFEHFARGEPDDPTGENDCVAVDRDGFWHDRPCQQPHAYVCEVD